MRIVSLTAIAALTACAGVAAAQTVTPRKEAMPAVEKPKSDSSREVAILAGGCFWGMEDIIRKIPGVIETEVGYSGGESSGASYETVKTGKTGHAESIQVVFDPKKLSYEQLLGWFFRM